MEAYEPTQITWYTILKVKKPGLTVVQLQLNLKL